MSVPSVSPRVLKYLKPAEKLDNNKTSGFCYLNETSLRAFVVTSQLPNASEVAKLLGINKETIYIRKEIEIIGCIQDVLVQMMIPFEFQKKSF